ncbi:MAG: DUF4118 domain-containing protein [Sterolibacteriaceae bacterium MAG5]|nr:DUF4118 domain-containing protein [Candidatus Nitricoxidireducens bremensis]
MALVAFICCYLFRPSLANIVMLFLLTVAVVAVTFGRGPAVAAAFASVALFDFFFVPPRFSMAVDDVQYLITFSVMLIVALIVGGLTARLREEADAAARREAQTAALYVMAKNLSGALRAEQVAETARDFVSGHVEAVATLYLPDGAEGLHPVPTQEGLAAAIPHIRAVYEQGEPMVLAAAESAYAPALALPLQSPLRTRGVLLVSAEGDSRLFAPERRSLLEAVASLVAIAVERLHFSEVAQQATLAMESERLRSALLSAVSHDLRTPLTVLVGLADSLRMARPALPAAQAETAAVLHEEALRLSGLVHNLLDMARLQVGARRLNREWQPLEEVVGSSLRHMERSLAGRCVRLDLAADLPLLELDAVLMERVFCNLIENAAKYAPTGELKIEARRVDDRVEVAVADRGPGLPPGGGEKLFGLFERGRHEDSAGGVGLGLAICRVIVEAHGGRIRAEERPGGGARFVFDLPVGDPPVIDEDAHGQ